MVVGRGGRRNQCAAPRIGGSYIVSCLLGASTSTARCKLPTTAPRQSSYRSARSQPAVGRKGSSAKIMLRDSLHGAGFVHGIDFEQNVTEPVAKTWRLLILGVGFSLKSGRSRDKKWHQGRCEVTVISGIPAQRQSNLSDCPAVCSMRWWV